LHQIEGRISNYLLKRKQTSKKTSIVCQALLIRFWAYMLGDNCLVSEEEKKRKTLSCMSSTIFLYKQ